MKCPFVGHKTGRKTLNTRDIIKYEKIRKNNLKTTIRKRTTHMKNKLKRIELLERLLNDLDPEPVEITVTVHAGENKTDVDEIKYKIEAGEYDELKKELNIKKIILLERMDEDE